MRFLRFVGLSVSLFTLTCLLCWVTISLLQFSPLFGITVFLLGTLGVVLAIDMVVAFFSQ